MDEKFFGKENFSIISYVDGPEDDRYIQGLVKQPDAETVSFYIGLEDKDFGIANSQMLPEVFREKFEILGDIVYPFQEVSIHCFNMPDKDSQIFGVLQQFQEDIGNYSSIASLQCENQWGEKITQYIPFNTPEDLMNGVHDIFNYYERDEFYYKNSFVTPEDKISMFDVKYRGDVEILSSDEDSKIHTGNLFVEGARIPFVYNQAEKTIFIPEPYSQMPNIQEVYDAVGVRVAKEIDPEAVADKEPISFDEMNVQYDMSIVYFKNDFNGKYDFEIEIKGKYFGGEYDPKTGEAHVFEDYHKDVPDMFYQAETINEVVAERIADGLEMGHQAGKINPPKSIGPEFDAFDIKFNSEVVKCEYNERLNIYEATVKINDDYMMLLYNKEGESVGIPDEYMANKSVRENYDLMFSEFADKIGSRVEAMEAPQEYSSLSDQIFEAQNEIDNTGKSSEAIDRDSTGFGDDR